MIFKGGWMNREIKFRAWKEGYMTYEEITFYEGQAGYVDRDGDFYYYSDEVVIMQYTGLKDKNGKEIYEGDIITYHNFIKFTGIVWWCDKDATYLVDLSQTKNKFINTSNHQITLSSVLGGDNNTEIIGNIYENPELLKGDE